MSDSVAKKAVREFEALHFYRWYWREWRASRRIQRLAIEARGIVHELLDECWDKGSIPDDPRELAGICNCSVTVIRKHWPAVRPLFTPIDGGRLINERLDHERTETDRKRIANAENGRKGGAARRHEPTPSERLANGKRPLANGKPEEQLAVAVQSTRRGAGKNGVILSPSELDQVKRRYPTDWREVLRQAGVRETAPSDEDNDDDDGTPFGNGKPR